MRVIGWRHVSGGNRSNETSVELAMSHTMKLFVGLHSSYSFRGAFVVQQNASNS